MDGRYQTSPFAGQPAGHVFRADDVRVEEGAVVEGPAFLDEGVVVRAGARVGPYSVLGRGCQVEADARVEGAIFWHNGRVGQEAVVTGRHRGPQRARGPRRDGGRRRRAGRQDGHHRLQ